METAYSRGHLTRAVAHLTIAVVATLALSGCLLLSSAPERPDELGADAGVSDTGVDVSPDQRDQANPDVPADSGQDVEPQLASLVGNVSRSAEPQNGGVGPIYIAVLESNPLINPGSDIMGVDFIASADLSSSDASVPYSIEDIPVSDEPYFILAFLDDDNNAGTVYPTPRSPDLIAAEILTGVSLPTIELSEAREYELDIVLTVVYPF